jgi:hypothetical protein
MHNPPRPTLPEFAQPTTSRAIGNLRVEQGLPKAIPGQFGDPAATQAASDFYTQLQSRVSTPWLASYSVALTTWG